MEAKRVGNVAYGAIVTAIILIASVYAFTKTLPFGGGYEVKVMFENAGNMRATTQVKPQVRIAGVQVGEVTAVEHVDQEPGSAESADRGADGAGTASLVTMQISNEGRPIRTDATFQLRPRLFLEGNLFVEMKPGSPSAPEAPDGHVFGPESASRSVQLDEVLTTLQQPVRRDLQVLVREFGSALVDHGGAEGFRELARTSPRAFRTTAQVNEAFLGTEPHDLSGAISNLDEVLAALGENQGELASLVTNLRIATGSLAAEDESLSAAIAELPAALEEGAPALAKVDASLPSLRALARELESGARASVPALEAGTPWAEQLAALLSRAEAGGVLAELRRATPDLAALTASTAELMPEARAVGSCFNEVVIPWANDRVDDPFEPATGANFQELGYGLVGINGESRNHDANAPYIRALAGSGANIVEYPPSLGRPEGAVGVTPYPILGAVPAIASSAKTPYRPDVPCETQEPPDLRALTGRPPPQHAASEATVPAIDRLRKAYGEVIEGYGRAAKARSAGERGLARRLFEQALKGQLRFERKRLPELNAGILALGGNR